MIDIDRLIEAIEDGKVEITDQRSDHWLCRGHPGYIVLTIDGAPKMGIKGFLFPSLHALHGDRCKVEVTGSCRKLKRVCLKYKRKQYKEACAAYNRRQNEAANRHAKDFRDKLNEITAEVYEDT